jgi:hypothetical protein
MSTAVELIEAEVLLYKWQQQGLIRINSDRLFGTFIADDVLGLQ